MEVHPAAAADDGRARLLVHALDVVQADEGRLPGRDGLLGRADVQCRLRRPEPGSSACVAVEAVLAVVVAGLDLDQADVQPGVAVGGERQRARRR